MKINLFQKKLRILGHRPKGWVGADPQTTFISSSKLGHALWVGRSKTIPHKVLLLSLFIHVKINKIVNF